MKKKAILLVLGVLATSVWVVVYPLQSAVGSSDDAAYADCTYYSAHKEMFLSNEARRDREYERISTRLKRLPAAPGQSTATMEPKTFIDWEILGKMQQAGISPAPLCSDEEFARRVYLDATGRIPSADDVREFLASTDSEKRSHLIDKLLRTPEYSDRWALFLGDLTEEVGNSSQTGVNLYNQGRNVWYDYIRQSLWENKPYSEFATELITATTSPTVTTWDSGPANYIARWRQGNGPVHDTWDNLAEAVGRHFMGMSLNCISCHNGAGHTNTINLFLTGRTRNDFWGMGAYFARISGANNSTNVNAAIVGEQIVDPRSANNRLTRYRINEIPNREYTLNTNNGNKTPRTGKANEFVKPSFILTGESPGASEPYRVALARQLVQNRQFARATVNYVWKELFGIGLVEPADNFDPARLDPNAQLPEGWKVQPTHPVLLEKLADFFINTNYNFFSLVEIIMKSSSYQLSSRYDGTWSDNYIPYFARKYPKRLSAEALHDAIVKATNVPPNPLFDKEYLYYNTNVPDGTMPSWQYRMEKVAWAMQLPDTKSGNNNGESFNFLGVFLRGDRDVIPRSGESSLLQELNMFNNQFVVRRIKNNGTSTVSQLLRKNLPPVDLVNELYLATLSRRPTPSEQAAGVVYITKGTLANRVEDLQFVLLNKVDFMFNY